MLDLPLRHLKDHLTEPLTRHIPKSITPNHITLLAFLSGLLSILTGAFAPTTVWPLTCWLLNRLLDGLDGTLARSRNCSTALGGFLDLLGDFIVYSLIPIALAYGLESSISLSALGADAGVRMGAQNLQPAVSLAGFSVVGVWRAVAVLEATFHINNFVLFYVAAVGARTEGGLTSVAMRPALVEGLESGLLFTSMFFRPRWLGWWCWVMSAAVAISVMQRVGFVVPVLKGVEGLSRKDAGDREVIKETKDE